MLSIASHLTAICHSMNGAFGDEDSFSALRLCLVKGKDKLTDVLIDSVKADDGILIHLSTEEYEHLFDWQVAGLVAVQPSIS